MHPKLARNRRGFALALVVVGIFVLLGVSLGMYRSTESFRLSTISTKDKRFLTEKALTGTDLIRKHTLNYIKTLTENFNPQNPLTITSLSASQIGFNPDPGEDISLRCIGQGEFRFSQQGGTLDACTNHPQIFPKVFELSYRARNADGSVVANVEQAFHLGPEGLNRFAMIVTGSTDSRIQFAGGTFGAAVVFQFDSSVVHPAFQFINVNSPVTFTEPFHSNVSPITNSYFGLSGLTSQAGGVVGPITYEKGFVEYASGYSFKAIDLSERFLAQNAQTPGTITEMGVPPNSLVKSAKVYLGGQNSTDRCLFQVESAIETRTCTKTQAAVREVCKTYTKSPTAVSAETMAQPDIELEMKLDVFPKKTQFADFIGAPLNWLFALSSLAQKLSSDTTTSDQSGASSVDATSISSDISLYTGSPTLEEDSQTLTATDETSIGTCVDSMIANLNTKVYFSGQNFFIWDNALETFKTKSVTAVTEEHCPKLQITRMPTSNVTPEVCISKVKTQSNKTAGFTKQGDLQTCTSTTSIHRYPSNPSPVTQNAIYWIKSDGPVEFVPRSGNFMSVCEKFTIVTDAPSTVLKASVLQSHATSIVDPKADGFAPSPKNNNFLLVLRRGDLVVSSDAAPLSSTESTTLSGLKALNVGSDKENLRLEMVIAAEQGRPLTMGHPLTSTTQTGTFGAVTVFGSLLGKESAQTSRVIQYGSSTVRSGASQTNYLYNPTLETSAPTGLEYGSGATPMVATVLNQEIRFVDVAEALRQAQRPTANPN